MLLTVIAMAHHGNRTRTYRDFVVGTDMIAYPDSQISRSLLRVRLASSAVDIDLMVVKVQAIAVRVRKRIKHNDGCGCCEWRSR